MSRLIRFLSRVIAKYMSRLTVINQLEAEIRAAECERARMIEQLRELQANVMCVDATLTKQYEDALQRICGTESIGSARAMAVAALSGRNSGIQRESIW